jgi:2-polyprenyl-3-methyl-5-hydroxy-6-metoxy-1,4-benzoquinol methylase
MIDNKIDKEVIIKDDDILQMLDDLIEKRDEGWWDKFYSNKEKPIPFFINAPDENLVSYMDNSFARRGKVLDIGCGNGRNSIYLAKQGFEVQGIDFSRNSIEWAYQNAIDAFVEVNFINQSIFNFSPPPGSYDYIYDGGCLHHIKPHRRKQYLDKIHSLLKEEGYFGLTCFNLKGGANISDYDVYRDFSMHGGLGFSERKIKAVLEPYFTIIEFREMREITDNSLFGKEFCWAILLKKK